MNYKRNISSQSTSHVEFSFIKLLFLLICVCVGGVLGMFLSSQYKMFLPVGCSKKNFGEMLHLRNF